jgi:hypothetical protein
MSPQEYEAKQIKFDIKLRFFKMKILVHPQP